MSSLKSPFFSVVIPTYNRLPYLKLALNSVLRQDFQDLEIVIVDDASTDGTWQWLSEMVRTESRLKIFLHEKNQGVSAARNLAISQAQAPWICFLDSDDTWELNKLTICFDYILNQNAHPIIHSHEVWIRDEKVVKQKILRPSGDSFLMSVEQCCIGPSTSVVHKKVFEKCGFFRPDFLVCEDYDFWLRATSEFLVTLIPLPLVEKKGGHEDQLSTRFHSMDIWRLRALGFQLWNPFLNNTKKKYVAEHMLKKSNLLLKGFEKYQNFKNKELTEQLQKQALIFLEKLTKSNTYEAD